MDVNPTWFTVFTNQRAISRMLVAFFIYLQMRHLRKQTDINIR